MTRGNGSKLFIDVWNEFFDDQLFSGNRTIRRIAEKTGLAAVDEDENRRSKTFARVAPVFCVGEIRTLVPFVAVQIIDDGEALFGLSIVFRRQADVVAHLGLECRTPKGAV